MRVGEKRKMRQGLMKDEKQREWLKRKMKNSGADLLECLAMPARRTGQLQEQRGGKHKVTHYALLFEGILRVVDPDLLQATIQSGIGPAKGFGFGLLSLASLKG